jgi:hypothetical protein
MKRMAEIGGRQAGPRQGLFTPRLHVRYIRPLGERTVSPSNVNSCDRPLDTKVKGVSNTEPTGVPSSERTKAIVLLLAASFVLLAAPTAEAQQQLMVYPSQGQTPEQQARDQAECRSWATQQTGFDPAYQSPPPTTAAPAPQGGLLRGAARGALVGVTVGAIAGDAGTGAAAGAAGGALIGGFRRADQRRAHEQQQAQAQAQHQQQMTAQIQTYNRAVSACLQGRGYTVQ